MSMDRLRRRRYLDEAEVRIEQIEQTVGELRYDWEASSERLPVPEAELGRAQVREMQVDGAVIGAYYNHVALRTDQDARMTVDRRDQDADRALLEEYISPTTNSSGRGATPACGIRWST